tara:strand:- start:3893 stop:4564 length:672 start_codon:yes stop_codon:yes gene_type:complete
MDSSDNKSSAQVKATGSSGVLFIIYCIILFNSSKDEFDLLNVTDYYNLVEFNTYGFLAILIGGICTAWIVMVAKSSENSCMESLAVSVGSIFGIGILVVLIWSLVLLGTVMHHHLEYTIPFYNKFWTTGVMNFSLADQPTMNITTITNITHGRNLMLENTIQSNRRLLENQVEITKHWPFIMTDIVVRISTGGLILILTIIAALGCCFGSGAICSSICAGDKQ